jgi:hypothetical protein
MRRVTDFKGYRSFIVYDADGGVFIAESIPEDRMQMTLDEAMQAWGEILPFPQPKPEKTKAKPRKAG